MRSTFSAGRLLRAGCCWAVLIGLAIAPMGCSQAPAKKAKRGDATAPDGGTASSDEQGVEGIDFDTALPVDDGRIAVCGPTGWTRGPQSKDHLVKYIPSRKKTFPSIVVTAADAPEGFADVEAATHRDFVAAIASGLAATFSKDGKSTLVKKPAAVKLGPHFGVTWAAPATVKVDGVKESIDRSSYALVIGGRMYTVEVRAPKGKLDDAGRKTARAVAAALGPPQPDRPIEPEPMAEPADSPDAKPDDTSDEPAAEPAAAAAGS